MAEVLNLPVGATEADARTLSEELWEIHRPAAIRDARDVTERGRLWLQHPSNGRWALLIPDDWEPIVHPAHDPDATPPTMLRATANSQGAADALLVAGQKITKAALQSACSGAYLQQQQALEAGWPGEALGLGKVSVIGNSNEVTTITNKDKGIFLSDRDLVIIKNVTIDNCRDGIDLRGCKDVLIDGLAVIPGSRNNTRFSRGIIIGAFGSPCETVKIKNYDCGVLGAPSGDYSTYNRDCISIERDCGIVLIRDSFLRGCTDGCIDAKSDFIVQDTLFGPSHRQVRVWSNVTGLHRNNTFEANPGHTQVWQQQPNSIWADYTGSPHYDFLA